MMGYDYTDLQQCHICGKMFNEEDMYVILPKTFICPICNNRMAKVDLEDTGGLFSIGKSDIVQCYASAKFRPFDTDVLISYNGIRDFGNLLALRNAQVEAKNNKIRFCIQSWISDIEKEMKIILQGTSTGTNYPLTLALYMWIQREMKRHGVENNNICDLCQQQFFGIFNNDLLDYLNRFFNRIDDNAASIGNFLNMFLIFRIMYEETLGDMILEGKITEIKEGVDLPFKSLIGLHGYLVLFHHIYMNWSVLISLNESTDKLVQKYFQMNHDFWKQVDEKIENNSTASLCELWNKFKEISDFSMESFQSIADVYTLDFHWYNEDAAEQASNTINPKCILKSSSFLDMSIFGMRV